MDEPLSQYPEKEQAELFIIFGDADVGEPCMFGKVICLSGFYCLCCKMGISTYMSEEQVSEQIYTDLNDEEDVRLDEIRE